MLVGGLSVLQLSSVVVRVAAAEIAPFPWTWSAMVAAAGWAVLCLSAAAAEAGGWRFPARLLGHGRTRAVALWPILGVALIAAGQAGLGFLHYVQLPVAVVLIGWCVGRLAGAARARADADQARPRWAGWLAVGLAAAAALFWYASLQGMTAGGHLGYPDVGIFASRLINTVRGVWTFRENPDAVAFWDHFNPGLYVLTPVVAVFNAVAVLNAVGALAAAGPAVVWFWFARRRGWSARASVGFAVGWLLLPGVSQALFSTSLGFHPVLLAMPLVAVSLVLLDGRRWIAFALCALAACSFRETVALSYVGVGLWLAALSDRRRAGLLILASAVVYFVVVTGVVIPSFRQGADYLGVDRFSHLGDGALEILLSPVLRPGAFWGSLLSQRSLVYVAVLFGCVGLVPVLRGGRRLLALAPEGLFLLLWNEPLTRSIAYHYDAVILVLLYWLSMDCVSGSPAGGSGPGRRRAPRWAWAMIGSAAAGSFFLGWWPGLRDTSPFDPLPSRRPSMDWVRRQIDENDTVAATRRAATHCTEAKAVYILPEHEPGPNAWPDLFVLDYADDWGRVDLPGFLPPVRRWHRRLMGSAYVATGVHEAIVVYRRDGLPVDQGRYRVDSLPQGVGIGRPTPVSPELTLLGWTLDGADGPRDRNGPRQIRVVAYLRVETAPTTDLGIALALRLRAHPRHNIAHSRVRPAGGMLAPSTDWRVGEIIAQRASLPWLLPRAPQPEGLMLVIELYDLQTGLAIAPAGRP